MEKKTFKIVKNILWPVKSVIEIGPEGILNKGKLVKWKEITKFSYSITSINGSMNYIVVYFDQEGKRHSLNYIVSLLGAKKKKELFAEIFSMVHEGFTIHHIRPAAEKMFGEIKAGREISLAGATLSKTGLEGQTGLIKKEKVFIPADEIKIEHPDGSGGFRVTSSANKKNSVHFGYEGGYETRYLLATLEKMFPQQAAVYN